MQLHELLTETARRFRDGTYTWAQHSMAYALDPDYPEIEVGDSIVRAKAVDTLHDRAFCFCALGGVARTAGVEGYWNLERAFPDLAPTLTHAIGDAPRREHSFSHVEWDISPFTDWNDSEHRTRDEVIAALERAAVLATPPDAED